jgi:A/G-specific adenine glycosylase
MNESLVKIFHAITEWFKQHKRVLPWRNHPTPYQVWVSEIMLQQTQVDVVLDYYLRWIQKFPTLKALASADEQAVMKAFAGLGYYSRAKKMHDTAKRCVNEHGGDIPHEKETLLQLPGIGSYTAGAILSFAFKKRAPAVDGNVLRVLSRLTGSYQSIDQEKTKKMFENLLQELLPQEEPEVAMEGLIEFGALICKKKPLCSSCPIASSCVAMSTDQIDQLPVTKKKSPITKITKNIYIYTYQNRYWIERQSPGNFNAGLYEFTDRAWEVEGHQTANLLPVRSAITTHLFMLQPKVIDLVNEESSKNEWRTEDEIDRLPLSSAHQKIWMQVKKHARLGSYKSQEHPDRGEALGMKD